MPTREDTRTINKRGVSIALSHKASEMQEVRPYKTFKRGEPPVRKKPNNVNMSTEPQRKRSIIHALTRISAEGIRPAPSEQKIPSFNGFQATLHAKQDKSKAYYHKSYDQPPNKAVINDIMQKQMNIIKEKQMPFAFLVGDLPVYILIMELKCEHPDKYKSIIPFLGPFHTQCVMMAAMFKRYEGSELEEVLVQAGIVAAGSVNQALKGKHFRRGLRCIRLFYEALISKLLIDNPPNLTAKTKEKLCILRDTSNDQETRAAAHESLMEEEEISKIVNNILAFCKNEETDMANYWKDFLEMADALLQSVHAVHTVDLSEYINSVRAMLPWMLAYDKQKYGRWLPDFWAMILNLPADQFTFLKENFAQSITGNPYSNMAWCMWIETTMNKGSKLKSGWLSILKNEKQVLVHSRNVNNIARIRAIHNAAAKRKSSNWKHTECNPKRLKLDEEGLQNILGCLEEYGAYPFDLDNQILRTMQSGVPASPELVMDLKSSNKDGEKRLKDILNERVYSKERSLHAKMKKMNRKTFTTYILAKDPKDKKIKIAEMEQAALKSVLDLVEKSDVRNLEQILEHRVTEESTSLYNADGTYRKSAKSQLLKKMHINSKVIEDKYTAIVDMGMMWRLAMPAMDEKSADTDEKYKWRDYGHNVANTILARHHNASKIICVNDVYDSTYSTKDDERILREKGLGNIPNEHYKPEGNFPSRIKFNKILRKPENKIRLQKFILKALQEKVVQCEKIIIYSTGKQCEDIATGTEMETLQFDHNEADTIMLSMYTKLRDDGFNGIVVLDAADTDVYVAAAYISNQCPGELFIKRGSDNVNCKSLVNDSMVNCIIPLHTMTGCDANSGFYGKGKGMLFDKVHSSERAKQQLQHCGLDKEIAEKDLQELMSFTRELVYGDFHSKSMSESRALKWRSQKKKSFCRLPPDEDSMRYHIKRANYLAYLLRNPSLRDHPSPIDKGWELINRICRPVRYSKPPLPDHLSVNDPDHISEHDSDGNSRNEQDSRNDGDSDDDEYDSDSETDSESGNSDNEFDDIDYSTEEEYSDIE